MHWLRRLRLELARTATIAPRRPVSRGGLTNGQRLDIYARGRGVLNLTAAQRRRIRKHGNRAHGSEVTTT